MKAAVIAAVLLAAAPAAQALEFAAPLAHAPAGVTPVGPWDHDDYGGGYGDSYGGRGYGDGYGGRGYGGGYGRHGDWDRPRYGGGDPCARARNGLRESRNNHRLASYNLTILGQLCGNGNLACIAAYQSNYNNSVSGLRNAERTARYACGGY